MKSALRAAVLLCCLLIHSSIAAPRPAPEPGVTAFVDVTVIPMDRERVLQNQTVIVRDGKISEIGPASSVRVPEGAARIDGRGKFLLPGLADMNVQFGPGQGEAKDSAGRTMRLLLANGVTTVRSMAGNPTHITLRDRIAKGEIVGPVVYAGGPPLTGQILKTADDARKAVQEQKKAGYDFIRVVVGYPLEAYDAVIATAREEGIPVAGLVEPNVGLEHAAKSHQELDLLDGFMEAAVRDGSRFPRSRGQLDPGRILVELDESKIPAIVKMIRESGAWVCPAMDLFVAASGPIDVAAMNKRPEMRYIPDSAKENWGFLFRPREDDPFDPRHVQIWMGFRNKMLKALHSAGVGILAGSNTPQVFRAPGFAIHAELRALVGAGLTPYQALESATRRPAEYIAENQKTPPEFGTIEAGKRADLLLLDANPLENISHTSRRVGVMARGAWLTEADLQKMLEEAAAALQAQQQPPKP